MTVTFRISGVVPGLNGAGGLLRMHWAARGRLKKRYALELVATASARDYLLWGDRKRKVVVRRYGMRAMDMDNLASAAKLLMDALVQILVLEDDSPEHVDLSFEQEVVAHRSEQHTEVEVSVEDP